MGSSSSNVESHKSAVETAKQRLEDAKRNVEEYKRHHQLKYMDAGARRYYKSQLAAYQDAVKRCKERLAWEKERLAEAKEQERKNKK